MGLGFCTGILGSEARILLSTEFGQEKGTAVSGEFAWHALPSGDQALVPTSA